MVEDFLVPTTSQEVELSPPAAGGEGEAKNPVRHPYAS